MSVISNGEFAPIQDRMPENWGSIENLCVQLADTVEGHCEATGEQFDMVIYIPRGGLHVVNLVARRLGFGPEHVYAHVNSLYSGEVNDRDVAGQKLTQEEAEGKNALLFEEVIDKGLTLSKTKPELIKLGLSLLRVGTLHLKDHSVFTPDWAMVRTSGSTWIDYPWEKHEKAGEVSKVRRLSAEEKTLASASR